MQSFFDSEIGIKETWSRIERLWTYTPNENTVKETLLCWTNNTYCTTSRWSFSLLKNFFYHIELLKRDFFMVLILNKI